MFEVKVEGSEELAKKFEAMRARVKALHETVPQLAQEFTTPSDDGEEEAEFAITGKSASTADLFGNIARGVMLHPSINRLAAKLIVSGRPPEKVIAILQEAMDASSASHDARWVKRRADIPRAVRSAQAKYIAHKRRRRQKKAVVSGTVTLPEGATSETGEVAQAVAVKLEEMAKEAMKWP